MLCPVCNVELLMSQKNNIEIDYCPKCRGIWLDRGELEKIVERSASVEKEINPRQSDSMDGYPHDDDDYKHRSYGNYKHKRKSFLGDLFDF